ncbi:hypothetical protein GGR55DRAFT_643339 [Xylaria sp. FL0064]|nr:hypothetical protein GGR55DRAFT_643339 [Xylaria sp. FL0064]
MDRNTSASVDSLPKALQAEIKDHCQGSRRIHVLYPAPNELFQWYQDFACPRYRYVPVLVEF